jgi:hypothetical protein
LNKKRYELKALILLEAFISKNWGKTKVENPSLGQFWGKIKG